MESPHNRCTVIYFLSDRWEFVDDDSRHTMFMGDDAGWRCAGDGVENYALDLGDVKIDGRQEVCREKEMLCQSDLELPQLAIM